MSDTKKLGLATIINIKANLDRLFGPELEGWPSWELETISDSLGMGFDDLARDKIHILQVLAHYPDMFLADMAFFLYAVKPINNEVADFDVIPMPSSLELAFALDQLCKVTNTTKVDLQSSEELIDCVSYLLTEEGYSEPIGIFDFIPADRLTPGQTALDTANKIRALELYQKHMESL